VTASRPILSDLDGTLLDSKASVIRVFEWWADLRGLAPGVANRIPHGRTSTAAAAVLAPHLDAAVEGALLDERQAEDTAGVVALRGAAELLATHRPLGIVTSCPIPLAHARMHAAGLPVPSTLVTPECTTHAKPDPEPYLLGATLLGVEAGDCVVLEDAPAGVAAGRAAGMTVVALLTTHGRADLPGAAAYIADLTEIESVLAALAE
jgi:sugar-phosphatase